VIKCYGLVQIDLPVPGSGIDNFLPQENAQPEPTKIVIIIIIRMK
jgi:hypothetical protein